MKFSPSIWDILARSTLAVVLTFSHPEQVLSSDQLVEAEVEASPYFEGVLFDGSWDTIPSDVSNRDDGLLHVASSSFTRENSAGIRIRLSSLDFAKFENQTVVVDVLNFDNTVVETLDLNSYAGVEYWTKTLEGDTVSLRAYSNRPTELDLGKIEFFRIPLPDSLGLEGVLGDDDRLHVNEFLSDPHDDSTAKAVAKIENSVVKVEVGFSVCSGFRVSDTVFITNAHCFLSEKQCKFTNLKLGFEKPVNGNHWTIFQGTIVPQRANHEDLRCKSVSLFPELDLAIIEVDSVADKKKWPIAEIAESTDGSKLLLSVQHPSGYRKRVIAGGCEILHHRVRAKNAVDDRALAHTCDTNTGSSGSPLFNLQGQVVGLHFGESIGMNLAVRPEYLKGKLLEQGAF